AAATNRLRRLPRCRRHQTTVPDSLVIPRTRVGTQGRRDQTERSTGRCKVQSASLSPVNIDQMRASDWEQVRAIYLDGIRSGHATFETDAPSWEKWDEGHLDIGRLVMRDGETILGWAALSPVSKRHVYRGVAEVTVYVSENARGKGIGRTLLEALIDES